MEEQEENKNLNLKDEEEQGLLFDGKVEQLGLDEDDEGEEDEDVSIINKQQPQQQPSEQEFKEFCELDIQDFKVVLGSNMFSSLDLFSKAYGTYLHYQKLNKRLKKRLGYAG